MYFFVGMLAALVTTVWGGWTIIQDQKAIVKQGGEDSTGMTILGYGLVVVGSICFLKLGFVFLMALFAPPVPWYQFW